MSDSLRIYDSEVDDEPLPWFSSHTAEAASARMQAWAGGRFAELSEQDWLNLARVALELRPRGMS